MLRRDHAKPSTLPSADAMDVVLPKLHRLAEVPDLPYKRKLLENIDKYYF